MNKINEYKGYRTAELANGKAPMNYMAWCNWQLIVSKSINAKVREV